jgi:hypothetical protein
MTFQIVGSGVGRIQAGEDSHVHVLQEGQASLVVERGDLVVSVFAVVQPDLADLGLLAGERVGEVVIDAEGFAEITQFLISFAPNQSISA